MAADRASWTAETERAFKEILYRFMGEVHATKAALYLRRPDHSWRVAVHYGFGRRDRLQRELSDDHTIVRMMRAFGNDPRFYNDLSEMPEIEDYLSRAGTCRFMLVPIAGADGDDGPVGFVDVRDKGAQRPFGAADLEVSREIALALGELIAGRSESATEEPPPPSQPATDGGFGGEADDAGDLPAPLDERGFDELNRAAAEALADPRIAAVAVTVADRRSAATVAHQLSGAPAVEVEPLLRHQTETVKAASLPVPARGAWEVEVRRWPGPAALTRQPIVASGVLYRIDGCSFVASVVADGRPDELRLVLDRLAARLRAAHERYALRLARRGLARRLLQPGDRRFPELVAHSLGVARLSWAMAGVLGLGEAMIEEATLAGLLHDVGMRELDYDRLYMHPTPGPEDRRTYRMHVEVGERIVRVQGFDGIADAVRHHHERWDGNGYPDRLAGDEIPLLSRIVHVAEVFDLFTAANSYRPAVSRERALAILDRAAGHQFDPEVVTAMTEVVA